MKNVKPTAREAAREEILSAIFSLATRSIEDASYDNRGNEYLTPAVAKSKIEQQRKIYNKLALQWNADEWFVTGEAISRGLQI